MELTPGQRKLAFAAIVLALAGLGAFLLAPAARQAAGASASPTTAARPSATGPAPASPTPDAAPSAAPTSASAVDIYRLLPFTQADLDEAVSDTQRFGVYYGEYSYQESAAAYVAPMRALATAQLVATIERGFATPGVAAVRVKQKQVASASATVVGMRAFGPTSLTFLLKVAQSVKAAQGASTLTTLYAVTVTRVAGGWQVNDIQLASAGNS